MRIPRCSPRHVALLRVDRVRVLTSAAALWSPCCGLSLRPKRPEPLLQLRRRAAYRLLRSGIGLTRSFDGDASLLPGLPQRQLTAISGAAQ